VSDSAAVPTAGTVGWPSRGVAWYGVAVLMLAAILSLVDRQVLNLLVDPIRASLSLTDVQIGVLQGPAFMVCYTLLGFPAGLLVDRVHRLRLVAAGIAIWSAATIACGLATSYEGMLLARALVGTGEAVLAPATISLIADYFAPLDRPVAMSVNGTAANAGIGLSLLAGGLLMDATRGMTPIAFAGLPPIEGWRLVFIVCGAPGLFVALLLLAGREPPRQQERARGDPAARFVPFLAVARRWILPHFAAISLIAVLSYGFMSWVPAYVIRRYDWSVGDAGRVLGLLFVTLGPAGALAGGFLTRRRQRRGQSDAPLRVVRLLMLAMAAAVASLAFEWTGRTVLAPLAVAVFALSALPIVSATALQQVTPGEVRGRMAAVYYISTNLIGASLGPLVTAALVQWVLKDSKQVGLSLAVLALATAPLAWLLLSIALRPYRNLAAAVQRL
jgi:MFS family permease